MNPRHKKFIYPLLAALIPLAMPLNLGGVFVFSTLLGAGVLAAVYLFEILEDLLPRQVLRLSVVLFAAAVFQLVGSLVSLPPFWFAAFALLLNWNDFERNHLGPQPLPPLVRVGIFWCASLWLAAVRQIAGMGFGFKIFEQPAGLLLALSFFSVWILASEKPLEPLWRLKRRKK